MRRIRKCRLSILIAALFISVGATIPLAGWTAFPHERTVWGMAAVVWLGAGLALWSLLLLRWKPKETPAEVDRNLRMANGEVERRVMNRTEGLGCAIIFSQEEAGKHRRIEDALRKSEERLALALDSTNDGYFDWRMDTGQAYFSPRYYTMLGYKPEEFVPSFENWRDMLHPDDLQHALQTVSDLQRGEYSEYSIEFRLRTKDGQWLWILSRGRVVERDAAGKATRMAGTHSDISERKRAEEVLRDSEKQLRRERALLRALIDSISDLIFFKDNDSVYLGCNKAFEIYSGMPESELIGRTDLEIAPSEIAKLYRLIDREMLSSGIPQRNEEWIPFKNGGGGYFDTLKSPFYGPDNELLGLIGVSRDITERRRMQQAIEKRLIALTSPLDTAEGIEFEDLFDLNEIQKLQDRFAEACGVASIITHTDGTPITKPSSFSRLCKNIIRGTEKGLRNCYHSDSVIGRHNPDGPNIQRCLSGGFLDGGASISVDGRHIANWLIGQVRDDSQEEAQMRAYAREIGADEEAFMEAFQEVPSMSKEQFERVAQALFTLAEQLSSMAYQNMQQARFITERKQAEEALRESEEKYRLLVENAREAIYVVQQGNIMFVNKTFEQLTGLSVQELVGRCMYDFFPPEEHTNARDHHDRIMRGEVPPGQAEFQLSVPGRAETWVSINAVPISWHGNPATLNFATDITERKRAEEERARVETQLRQAQKMEALGTLAGGIAHDFNNILAIIVGYTEMARLAIPEGGELSQELGEVLQAAHRAKELVKQILAFSRHSEQGKKPVQVGLIVKEASKMLRASLPSTIKIKVAVVSKAVVLADPTQIHQVLMNLCTNAAHAMQDNGGVLEISLTDAYLEPDHIRPHSGLQSGQYVKLSVKDTGHGIDPAVMHRIFDPFFTTKEPGRGTGLGLAVVHGILKNHMGAIDAESIPGQGSTFTVLLPVIESEPALNAAESAPLPTGQERILVVDDEPALGRVLSLMLDRLGYEVDCRSDSFEALEVFRLQGSENSFSLVITDMTMPQLTGADLARELYRLRPDVPIILLTGFSQKIDAEKAKSLGIRGFLMKPVVLDELAKLVRQVLDGTTN